MAAENEKIKRKHMKRIQTTEPLTNTSEKKFRMLSKIIITGTVKQIIFKKSLRCTERTIFLYNAPF